MPTSPAEPDSRRLAQHRVSGIDGLRALAALAVFFCHLAEMPASTHGAISRAWRAVWQHGYLGVSLFFVISGVCIGRTWLGSATPGEFSLRRLRRIFPAYWGSLAVICALALAVKLIFGTNDVAVLPASGAALLATVTLATAPVSSFPPMSGVYWSLSFELAFYAVMTALLLAPPARRPAALTLAHALLCLLACRPGWSRIPLGFFIELWPLFGTGAALALWRDHRRLALAMFLASAVPAIAALLQHRLVAEWTTAILGTGLCAAALGGKLAFWPTPLVELGKISYSLYLLHVPIGGYFYFHALANRGPTEGSEILWQTAVVVATAFAIRPLYRWLEMPFLRPTARVNPPPA
jgi:peptidoglycan/LPS O-acetylase OafA/YrhL